MTSEKAPKLAQFKKYAFRYKARIGHLPKETEPFLIVQRKDPKTQITKVIPEVVYPIQANRPALPKHAMLEDDWRAFRSVLHNYQTMLRSQMDPMQFTVDYIRCNDMANRIYPKKLRSTRKMQPAVFVPVLSMYKDSMPAPLGYTYRRYKQGQSVDNHDRSLVSGRQELKTPVIVFEGPCMDTVHIPHGKRVKLEWDKEMEYYDADVIVTGLTNRKVFIYNEPDAIPESCARTDFSQPLSQRAIKEVTSFNIQSLKENIQTTPAN